MSTRDAFYSSWDTQIRDLQIEANCRKQENARLRGLLLDLIQAIIKERCMYPEIGSVVDKARKELAE